MTSRHQVKVTVHSVTKGKCPRGFKAGDTWTIEDGETPNGMCGDAYVSISPVIRILWLGGEQPWDKDKDTVYRSCPDVDHIVVYEIKRLK